MTAVGCVVVGPAASAGAARPLIAGAPVDAALLDCNLHGARSDEVAAALIERAIPFAFATGYDREAVPSQAPILSKPFSEEQLVDTIKGLLHQTRLPPRESRHQLASSIPRLHTRDIPHPYSSAAATLRDAHAPWTPCVETHGGQAHVARRVGGYSAREPMRDSPCSRATRSTL